MKSFAILTVLSGLMLFGTSGCGLFDTPGYSANERGQLIGRNWGYEYQQIQDDIDYGFLLRPTTELSPWNLR